MIVLGLKYLLTLYQKMSFIKQPHCRFYPSCSEYAKEALDKHGLLGGSFLALKRLLRCNQFFKGGFDPVPE
jgi:hypothetical protein